MSIDRLRDELTSITDKLFAGAANELGKIDYELERGVINAPIAAERLEEWFKEFSKPLNLVERIEIVLNDQQARRIQK